MTVHAETQKHVDTLTRIRRLPWWTVVSPSSVPSQGAKRLTLDLATDLHRTLKVRSAELDVPMVELLRQLIVEALADPSTLSELAERCRQPGDDV